MTILMGGGVTEAIIKPVQDTSSGVGVEKIKGAESIFARESKEKGYIYSAGMYCSK